MTCYKCGSSEGTASRLCSTCTEERLNARTTRVREKNHSTARVYRGGARPFPVSLICGLQFLISGISFLVIILMLVFLGIMGPSFFSQIDSMQAVFPEGFSGSTIALIMAVVMLVHFAMWVLYLYAVIWTWNMRLRGLYLHSAFHGLSLLTCSFSLLSGGEDGPAATMFTLVMSLVLLITPWVYKDRFA